MVGLWVVKSPSEANWLSMFRLVLFSSLIVRFAPKRYSQLAFSLRYKYVFACRETDRLYINLYAS